MGFIDYNIISIGMVFLFQQVKLNRRKFVIGKKMILKRKYLRSILINQQLQIFPVNHMKFLSSFFGEDVLRLLTTETVSYAAQQGNHGFLLSIGEMKVFVSILVLSCYTAVPRRRLLVCRTRHTDRMNLLQIQCAVTDLTRS